MMMFPAAVSSDNCQVQEHAAGKIAGGEGRGGAFSDRNGSVLPGLYTRALTGSVLPGLYTRVLTGSVLAPGLN